jgi:hypothetical protein
MSSNWLNSRTDRRSSDQSPLGVYKGEITSQSLLDNTRTIKSHTDNRRDTTRKQHRRQSTTDDTGALTASTCIYLQQKRRLNQQDGRKNRQTQTQTKTNGKESLGIDCRKRNKVEEIPESLSTPSTIFSSNSEVYRRQYPTVISLSLQEFQD